MLVLCKAKFTQHLSIFINILIISKAAAKKQPHSLSSLSLTNTWKCIYFRTFYQVGISLFFLVSLLLLCVKEKNNTKIIAIHPKQLTRTILSNRKSEQFLQTCTKLKNTSQRKQSIFVTEYSISFSLQFDQVNLLNHCYNCKLKQMNIINFKCSLWHPNQSERI